MQVMSPGRIIGPRFRNPALDPAFVLGFADLGAGAVSTGAEPTSVAPTFTRATTATTVDSAGLIVSVASGTPRSYYNPTSLEYLGYLTEGARTNISPDSAVQGTLDTATSWSAGLYGTITKNAAVSPDGATTAAKFAESVDTSAHAAYVGSNGIAVAADTVYTASCWVKAGTVSKAKVAWVTAGWASGVYVDVNLSTGAIVASAALGTGTLSGSSITAYPNGWYRIAVSGKLDAASTVGYITVNCTNSSYDLSYAGDVGNNLYFWGAQLEAAVFVSSYIPTTTVAVTRNQDVLRYPLTSAFPLSIYMNWRHNGIDGSAFDVSLQLDNGTDDERAALYRAAGSLPFTYVQITGVGQNDAAYSAGALVKDTTYRAACAFATNDVIGALDGTLGSADSLVTAPTGMNNLTLGAKTDASAAMFGPIRRVAYYPSRLPNATLQALTA